MDVRIVSRGEPAGRGHHRLAQLGQLANDMSERLPRFFKDIVFVEWSLDEDRVEKIAHCKLHAQKSFYRVTAVGDTHAHAMHLALEKLIERRRRDKQEHVRRRRSERLAATA